MDVIRFPLWKENCTPVESLREMLQYAEDHPEKVTGLMILWNDHKLIRHYNVDGQLSVKDALFLLEMTKFDLLKDM